MWIIMCRDWGFEIRINYQCAISNKIIDIVIVPVSVIQVQSHLYNFNDIIIIILQFRSLSSIETVQLHGQLREIKVQVLV